MHTHQDHRIKVSSAVRRPWMAIRSATITTLAAALGVAVVLPWSSGNAHADDGYVEYANTQRYYERFTAPAPRPPAACEGFGHHTVPPIIATAGVHRHPVATAKGTPRPAQHRRSLMGYVGAPRRATTATSAPICVQILAPQSAAHDEGHFLTFPNAEATGAAQGQTVNRAVNDLD